MKKILLLLLSCLGMSLFAQPYNLTWTKMDVANLPEEISVYTTTTPLNGRTFRAFYAIADMSTGNIEFRSLMGANRQTPSQFVSNYGSDAYVCVNGGYFDTGVTSSTSYSLVIDKGNVKSNNTDNVSRSGLTYYPTRGAIGVDNNQQGQCGWSTSVNGTPWLYPEPSPNVEGETPQPQPSNTFPSGGKAWTDAYSAIGGGPVLVMDGQNKLTDYSTNYELLQSDVFGSSVLAPRTAIGYRADGKIIFFICDGRQNTISQGARLDEVAQIMIELGCTNALNVDGGGSTAMVAGTSSNCLNSPSDGSQRAVASAVMFVKKTAPPESLNQMWNFTKASGDRPSPDWTFSDNNARDIATDGKYVYIPVRGNTNLDGVTGSYDPSVRVVNANTGQLYKTLSMNGVSGGTFIINSAAVTSDNKLLVGNMTTSVSASDPFKIYMYDLNNMDADPSLFFSFAGSAASGTTSVRIGDAFTFEGSTVNGKLRVMLNGATGKYLSWTIENGTVANNDPDVINLLQTDGSTYTSSPGSYPRVYAAGTDSVWIKGSGSRPSLFVLNKYAGTVGNVLNGNAGNVAVPFSYNGKPCLATVDYAGTQSIVEGVILDVTTTDGEQLYRTATNFGVTPSVINGTDGTAVYVTPTGFKVFFLSATQGVAAYSVGNTTDTGIQTTNPVNNTVFIYPNPARDIAYLSVFAKRITLYSLSGQIISQTVNSNQIGVKGLSGLYIVNVADIKGNSHNIRLIVR